MGERYYSEIVSGIPHETEMIPSELLQSDTEESRVVEPGNEIV